MGEICEKNKAFHLPCEIKKMARQKLQFPPPPPDIIMAAPLAMKEYGISVLVQKGL